MKDRLRSLLVVLVSALATYGAVRATGTMLVPFIEGIASGMLWALPLTLAVSVAMFNNMFKIYDRFEKVLQDFGSMPDSARPLESELSEVVDETDKLTAGLLGNAFTAIIAGVASLVVRGLRIIPLPGWYPNWVLKLTPFDISVSLEFAFCALIVVILFTQFRTILPLVELYRFFAVDRYRIGPRVAASEASLTAPQVPNAVQSAMPQQRHHDT